MTGAALGMSDRLLLATGPAAEAPPLRTDPTVGRTPLPTLTLDPETVQRDLSRLVLALMALLRHLLESQAISRMERGTLAPDEVERVGLALMRAEEALDELRCRFGLEPEDLNLDLGPLGTLF